jgi:hypothetical protein
MEADESRCRFIPNTHFIAGDFESMTGFVEQMASTLAELPNSQASVLTQATRDNQSCSIYPSGLLGYHNRTPKRHETPRPGQLPVLSANLWLPWRRASARYSTKAAVAENMDVIIGWDIYSPARFGQSRYSRDPGAAIGTP